MCVCCSTKQQTVDIIRCQPGETLTAVLDSDTTDEQELQHRSMITLQEQVDARAEDKELAVTRSKSVKDQSERKYVLPVVRAIGARLLLIALLLRVKSCVQSRHGLLY